MDMGYKNDPGIVQNFIYFFKPEMIEHLIVGPFSAIEKNTKIIDNL